MHTIGVFAIILNDKKEVLLCHRRDYDLWNLPGGGLEVGEAPWQGIVREVQEETGLDVQVRKLSGVYYKSEKDEVVFSFICEIFGGNISLTDEADRIEYFDSRNLPKNISQKQAERISDALNNNDIVFKIQEGLGAIDLIKQGKL